MILPAAETVPELAVVGAVTMWLSALRREHEAIQRVTDDQCAAEAEEHPDQIPRHALQDFAAVDVAADSK